MILDYAVVNAQLNHCLGFDIIACCALFESNHDLTREQNVSYPSYKALQSITLCYWYGTESGS